jgi:glycosyltransferase involved in cell wall biosynthesis
VSKLVTVALPVRNGGAMLDEVLGAVRAQRLTEPTSIELLVCDSGSTDGSVAVARRHGAEVIEIALREFSHGATRNLLMQRSQGDYVAFLTQDARPADEQWLARLLGGFQLADDVALVYGPYIPRTDASPFVARELVEWFGSLSPDGTARLDRLADQERELPPAELLGPRGFFTDANGAVARAAWESVPFRPVAYAEDHALAHDMLRAGYAKVYVPGASVIHSHEYSYGDWLRRSFDETRAMHEIYGFDQPRHWRGAALGVWGLVGADLRWARRSGRPARPLRLLGRSLTLHTMRAAGTMLGTRAHRLPRTAVRRLSLEGRP